MKDYKEIMDQAYLKYVEANYAYALFDVNLKIKWERACLEQQGFLPETKKNIPNFWRSKLKRQDSQILDFTDCSRELVKEAA